MREIKQVKNIILKVGTSSLCDQEGVLSKEKMLQVVQLVVTLTRASYKVTIVSSGAIGAGVGVLKPSSRPTTLPQKQAFAAIGQASLMKAYEDLFSMFSMHCAQILVTHDDFDDRNRLLNMTHALHALHDYQVVPIINENDTLAVQEIKVGDNDTLAALVVPVVQADLLVILSDIDGLYDDNPHTNPSAKLLQDIYSITPEIKAMAKDTTSAVGTGGMATKIKAATIVTDYGCDMAIINSSIPNGVLDLLAGKRIGSYFHGNNDTKLSSKNHWIYHRTLSKGKIIVDQGASLMISNKHTSLLASGIQEVVGNFMIGQVVEIMTTEGKCIARGIVNYSSDEIKLIKGQHSSKIKDILHYKDYDEVIHANNMVLVKRDQL